MINFLLYLSIAFAGTAEDVVISELTRVHEVLQTQESSPYYIAVTVIDSQEINISARDGTLNEQNETFRRSLDVDLRVGDTTLDNTHPLRGFSALDEDSRSPIYLPTDSDQALRHAVWRELDARYRDAAERIVVVRANQNVKVAELQGGQDFEPAEPATAHLETPQLVLDTEAWTQALVGASQILADSPAVHIHEIALTTIREEKTFVDTDGARLVHGRTHARVSLQASATAKDGDVISVFEAFDVHLPEDLPPVDDLQQWALEAVSRMQALHEAPRGEPYSGPVLLEGQATGVFFHEVLGHRVEGHRQKREDEGQTFAKHVGKPILPPFISVVDDPTVSQLAGQDLNGHYAYDDEGSAAAPAPLVEDGNFVGFMMGRSPLEDFTHTNGHGRRSTGNTPTSRMGNTLITSTKGVSRESLRKQLLALVRKQELEYGYIVEDIEGGFTLTGRTMPNAFNVRATASWRVFADGRPDQLVRGIDLVGTPLVAFGNLVATGDDPKVFNGTCGAESGWVPVSAVAPSILFSKLEFQLKEKGQERPPLLEKPARDGTADGGAP